MRFNCTRFLLLVGFALALLTVPIQAGASQCSTAAEAGNWAYTYAGTIFTQSGPLPAASVGHFRQYADGNITGSQTRSVAGQSGAEDIAGTVSINKRLHRQRNYQGAGQRTATTHGSTSARL
jgi:hypothetical protein